MSNDYEHYFKVKFDKPASEPAINPDWFKVSSMFLQNNGWYTAIPEEHTIIRAFLEPCGQILGNSFYETYVVHIALHPGTLEKPKHFGIDGAKTIARIIIDNLTEVYGYTEILPAGKYVRVRMDPNLGDVLLEEWVSGFDKEVQAGGVIDLGWIVQDHKGSEGIGLDALGRKVTTRQISE